jgi:putative DNA primase/helicase
MRKISDGRVHRQAQEDEPVKALSSAQRTALAVAQDYPVFPCDPVSKRPAIAGGSGFKDATQDTAQVLRWWQEYPQALIGVPTGSASGLLAIDCDPKCGDWYARHRKELGSYRLHGTRRGKHLLYQYPADSGIRISKSSDTVDVRGEGGYIIWWPAHGGVSVGELGKAPRWVVQLCTKLARTSATRLNGHAVVDESDSKDARKFKDGGRGDALSARAYHYRKMGMSTREIGQALLQYDLEHCEPPYQHTDGKAMVLYIARKKGHILTDAQHAVNVEVELIRADEEEESRVDWLWKGFLARNKFHLLSGSGGVMKSMLTLSLTATITRGGSWPDGARCPRGNVIIWTGEDDLGDTVKPRLRYAGADQTRCWFVKGVREGEQKREFDPARDALSLERACKEIGDVSMIIIDPIVVVVQKDNNSASDVRRSLSPLIALAARYNAVLLGIQHFTKGSKGKDPAERVLGSGAWVHAARIVLAAAAIDEGEGQHANNMVFTCVKTFAKSEGGFEYGFEEEPKTEIARIVWGKPLQGTGHHIISEAEGNGDGQSKLGTAKRFLTALLENGSMNVWEVNKRAEAAHISGITLKRAKRALGVETLQAGKSAFRWALPEDSDN